MFVGQKKSFLNAEGDSTTAVQTGTMDQLSLWVKQSIFDGRQPSNEDLNIALAASLAFAYKNNITITQQSISDNKDAIKKSISDYKTENIEPIKSKYKIIIIGLIVIFVFGLYYLSSKYKK